MISCRLCSASHPDGTAFCTECGHPLTVPDSDRRPVPDSGRPSRPGEEAVSGAAAIAQPDRAHGVGPVPEKTPGGASGESSGTEGMERPRTREKWHVATGAAVVIAISILAVATWIGPSVLVLSGVPPDGEISVDGRERRLVLQAGGLAYVPVRWGVHLVEVSVHGETVWSACVESWSWPIQRKIAVRPLPPLRCAEVHLPENAGLAMGVKESDAELGSVWYELFTSALQRSAEGKWLLCGPAGSKAGALISVDSEGREATHVVIADFTPGGTGVASISPLHVPATQTATEAGTSGESPGPEAPRSGEEKARVVDPARTEKYLNEAEALFQAGELEAAERLCARVVAREPRNERARTLLEKIRTTKAILGQ